MMTGRRQKGKVLDAGGGMQRDVVFFLKRAPDACLIHYIGGRYPWAE